MRYAPINFIPLFPSSLMAHHTFTGDMTTGLAGLAKPEATADHSSESAYRLETSYKRPFHVTLGTLTTTFAYT